jgi:hypothetical protein
MGFDDQRPQTRAARRIGRDPEQGFDVGRLPQHQRVRIAAQLDEARRMDYAVMPLSLVGAKPEEQRAAANRAKRQHGGKARSARPVIGFGREQFMHPPARKAAAERCVERGVSGRDPFVVGQQSAPGNRGQISPEHGKMINRLAHYLFLICSQLRLGPSRVKRAENQDKMTGRSGEHPYLPAACGDHSFDDVKPISRGLVQGNLAMTSETLSGAPRDRTVSIKFSAAAAGEAEVNCAASS